jgi:DNA-binding MarR family transcriptional regulator
MSPRRSVHPVECDQPAEATAFAERAGMTKQSLGEFVVAMEKDGMVTVEASPTDKRSKIVRCSPAGLAAAQAAADLIARVEAKFRTQVGAARYEVMRDVLRELGATSWKKDYEAERLENLHIDSPPMWT